MPVPEHLAPHLPAAQRKALFAAARVACVAALVSCGPKTSTPVEAPAASPPAAEAPAEPDAAPAAIDPAPAADPTVPTAEEVAECAAHVDAVFGADEPPDEVGEDTLDCCQTLADHQDSLQMSEELFLHRDECCAALDWMGSMACTPWGPPTPPPMPGRS